MTRYSGWDESLRQGYKAMGKMPMLTERKDLGSINHDTKAGWEGAMPNTDKRVDAKRGKSEAR